MTLSWAIHPRLRLFSSASAQGAVEMDPRNINVPSSVIDGCTRDPPLSPFVPSCLSSGKLTGSRFTMGRCWFDRRTLPHRIFPKPYPLPRREPAPLLVIAQCTLPSLLSGAVGQASGYHMIHLSWVCSWDALDYRKAVIQSPGAHGRKAVIQSPGAHGPAHQCPIKTDIPNLRHCELRLLG